MSDPQSSTFNEDICPYTSLRVFDQAMVNWLKSFRFRKQSPTVVTSWVSKQFSQKKELHSDETQRTPMSYPMVSLGPGGAITPDLERRQVNSTRGINGNPIWETDDKEAAYIVPWPMPITIPYQIDIWTKKMQDLRYLETALLSRFTYADTLYMDVEIPFYGTVMVRLELESVDDTSDLETGEEERELRKTASVTLHGWIFFRPQTTKTIQNGHVVFIDGASKTAGAEPGEDLFEDETFFDHYCDVDNYNFSSDYTLITSVDESPTHTPPNRALLWISFGEDGVVGTGGQA